MSPRDAYTALATEPQSPTNSSHEFLPEDELAPQWPITCGRWHEGCRTAADIFQSNTGLLLVTASQAFFSMMNTAVKKLNSIDPPVSTFEVRTVICGLIGHLFTETIAANPRSDGMSHTIFWCSCMRIEMILTKVPDPFLGPKGVRLLLVFRGFSGMIANSFFGLYGIYYSLQYLSLSDATVLTFLAPLCTGISGALFLKERYSKREALASVCSLLGVVLIARPAFLFGEPNVAVIADDLLALEYVEKGTPKQRLVAVGIALIGVLGLTGAYTSLAALGKRAHPMHAMTAFSSQCIVVSVIAMLIQRTPIVVPTELAWLGLLLMIGIFGFLAQILLTLGLQRETAGRGTIAVYTQVRKFEVYSWQTNLTRGPIKVVFAAILERIFFDPVPSVMSILGTLIIISAALYVAARIKKIMQKDEEVGKVAQATPVVISKALELFLGLIIEEANKVTAERGSKKVEAYHLKHAVETVETLDFLKDLVEAVPDPSAGGTIDLELENAEAAAKKKRGKGKKAAASGDGEPPKKRARKKKGDADVEARRAEAEAAAKSEPEHEHMREGEEDGHRSRHVASNYRPRSPNSDDEGYGEQPFMRH
ncbi:hypothetical protein DXG03_005218 [Asterophora parasitica]|uniref:Transcription factor CBF/NF-Y/archaeal histone domain-containing protein n=1 Tax=Asterophora parasitica TaxID=117018 RepID=A0A9P7K9U0_9AGAR|nr:hypothetical protein DXG03_005218 [Asterophora parasitica]